MEYKDKKFILNPESEHWDEENEGLVYTLRESTVEDHYDIWWTWEDEVEYSNVSVEEANQFVESGIWIIQE